MASHKIFLAVALSCLFQGFHSGYAQLDDFLIKRSTDDLTNSLDNILAENNAILEEIEEFSKDIAADIDDAPENLLSGILVNRPEVDNKTLECLIKHSDEVAAILSETKQSVQKCIDTAHAEVEAVKAIIEAIKNQLTKKIEEAKVIYAECAKENPNQPSAILNCLYIKGAKVGEEIQKLVKTLQHAVESARPQLAAIAERAKRCVIAALENGGKKIHQLVQDCLKEE